MQVRRRGRSGEDGSNECPTIICLPEPIPEQHNTSHHHMPYLVYVGIHIIYNCITLVFMITSIRSEVSIENTNVLG